MNKGKKKLFIRNEKEKKKKHNHQENSHQQSAIFQSQE